MWTHNNATFELSDLSAYYGFVYCITNRLTGKKYIGRKYFTEAKRRQVKGKKKTFRVESNWKDYWGSNSQLLAEIEQHGQESFDRKIVRLCKTRGETNYWEAKLIFSHDAVISEHFYNSWVSAKVHRKHIAKMELDNGDYQV
jgi:hypothetical protein